MIKRSRPDVGFAARRALLWTLLLLSFLLVGGETGAQRVGLVVAAAFSEGYRRGRFDPFCHSKTAAVQQRQQKVWSRLHEQQQQQQQQQQQENPNEEEITARTATVPHQVPFLFSSLQHKFLMAGTAAAVLFAAATTTTAVAAAPLTENQRLVADCWSVVTDQYVDRSFNGLGEQGWKVVRDRAVAAVAETGPLDDAEDTENQEAVYREVRAMLATLGDKYTRFLDPAQMQSLTAYANGGSAGGSIGVTLLLDPSSNRVLIANTVQNGPAQQAGLRPGDTILEVDGEAIREGTTAELVAAKCRGETGTALDLVVLKGEAKGSAKPTKISIKRATVQTNPVETSVFSVAPSSTTGTTAQTKIGLLKVSAFNKETPGQILDGIREIMKGGGSALVIDLRGNVGGYMPAGVDAARLFLPPRTRIITEVNGGSSGSSSSGTRAMATTKDYMSEGIGSETALPLFLLVDGRTASAAEIFAAALQDNQRATVVGAGASRTFGKGRIQNVQPVKGGGVGAGVAVTKAKYLTPNGKDIHGLGIAVNKEVPESACAPEDSAAKCLDGLL